MKKRFSGVIVLWILLGGILVLGVAALVALYAQSRLEISRAIQEGNALMAEGSYQEARTAYQEALQVDSSSQGALAAILRSYAQEGNREGNEFEARAEAIEYIERAKGVKNAGAELLIALGFVFETAGDYQGAVSYYDRATEKNPDSAQAWFHAGHAREFLGESERADAAYEKAYLLDPANPQVLLQKGREALLGGNLNQAGEYFLEAEKQAGPSYLKAEALAAASNVRRLQGDFLEAERLAGEALNFDQNYAQAAVAYGTVLGILGDMEAGVDWIYRAIQLNPRTVQPYWAMATILRGGEYVDEALEYLEAGIVRIDNDNTLVGPGAKVRVRAQMTYDLARLYDLKGESQQTLRLLEEAVVLHPELKEMIRIDMEENGYFQRLREHERLRALLSRD